MSQLQQTISRVNEQDRWRNECLNLIASENKLSPLAQALYSSDFVGRYAEGEPYKRHYQGTRFIDELETKAIELTKKLFNAEEVDLRPVSGSEANRIVLAAYCKPGDVIMSYATPSGGHFTHNSGARRYGFQTYSFPLTEDYFHLDIEKTKEELRRIKPKALVLGKSLFLFPEPIRELREIYDGPIIYDAAHVLGLIAGNKFQNPLEEGASVVTASTHKTFFGPQGGLIYTNRNNRQWYEIKRSIAQTVSNHHLMRIPPYIITCLEFMELGKEYAYQVIKNAKTLARALHRKGFDVKCAEFDFTESHQIAIDVSQYDGGKVVAERCEGNNVIINKNLLPYEKADRKTLGNPKGIRIGVQEMTRFGMAEKEMEEIAELTTEAIKGKNVKDEVVRFRQKFTEIKYTFPESSYSQLLKPLLNL